MNINSLKTSFKANKAKYLIGALFVGAVFALPKITNNSFCPSCIVKKANVANHTCSYCGKSN